MMRASGGARPVYLVRLARSRTIRIDGVTFTRATRVFYLINLMKYVVCGNEYSVYAKVIAQVS